MTLIFLYGQPATGKLTVAQELARLTGIRLFHNHLAVDLLLSTFDFGTPAFIELREKIWLDVFAEAGRSGLPHLIFTFNPETTVRPTFLPSLLATLHNTGSTVEFIELTCPLPELRARIDSPSRREFKKLTDPAFFDQLQAAGTFDTTHMPRPKLTLDTSTLTPAQAATQIAQALKLPTQPDPPSADEHSTPAESSPSATNPSADGAPYTSLGRSPRCLTKNRKRAESPAYTFVPERTILTTPSATEACHRSQGPKARQHDSLGRRPGYTSKTKSRAEGPTHRSQSATALEGAR